VHDYDATRRSWNIATRNHNAHKGDQAAFLRAGGDVLFPEELDLLGPLSGARLAHLQCNADLGAATGAQRGHNDLPAHAWQHGLGAIVTALAEADLRIECVREYPHANGCRVNPALVPGRDRRWVWPAGAGRVPLMFGLSARSI
jgi:hypothetical protein